LKDNALWNMRMLCIDWNLEQASDAVQIVEVVGIVACRAQINYRLERFHDAARITAF